MFAVRALYPCAVLFEPVVLEERDPEPVAVLRAPVVFEFKASLP